jgi:hypothetical protein
VTKQVVRENLRQFHSAPGEVVESLLAMPKRFVALVLGHDGLSFVHVGDLVAAATYQQVGVGKSAERSLAECKFENFWPFHHLL